VQVAELGPVSAIPGRQLNLIVLPSIAKMSFEPSTLGTESFVGNTCSSGSPQLARNKLIIM
ncbi:hypothetical protein AB9K17_23610, partial [Salmonella enterica subsp. enterica serovar Kentucky]|uniref:hypothetical protein n=1 Tax=Salmonella enterica TaxID=28901 RepID=UPI003F4B27BC